MDTWLNIRALLRFLVILNSLPFVIASDVAISRDYFGEFPRLRSQHLAMTPGN